MDTGRRVLIPFAVQLLLLPCAICITAGQAGGQVTGPSGSAQIHSVQWQLDLFDQEMKLAQKAEDRDSRVAHLRRALSYRPDHPDNLAIEFLIGVELSQRSDPEHNQGPLLVEALPVFEHIVSTYKHMDYYSPEVVGVSESPQLLVPRAAVLAACIQLGLNGDSAKARQSLMFAMECLKETYEQRIVDWTDEPAPPKPADDDPFEGGVPGIAKWRSRQAGWEQRQKDAAEGKVFGDHEMSAAKAAVRTYGYSFGQQRPYEVPVVMGEIVKRFPGTPMAELAKGHIDRAMQLTQIAMTKELPEELDISPSPSVDGSQEDGPRPVVNPAPANPPTATAGQAAEATPEGGFPYWPFVVAAAALSSAAAGAWLLRRHRAAIRRSP